MTVWQTLRVALRALMRNRTRSFLTTLGIIIGVSAVIAMVAIGDGAKARVEQSLASMGTNLLMLLPGTSSSGGVQGGYGSQPTLTWDDLRAIQSEVPSVRKAAPSLRVTMSVASEDQNWTTQVQGTTPEYFEIRSWGMRSGVPLIQSDVDAGAKAAVLGQTVVEKLYGRSADPVGQMVRINRVPFQIVGVMERKGQSASGSDYDDVVLIPVSTFATKIQGGLRAYINGVVYIGAVSSDATPRAAKQVSELLRDRHHQPDGVDDDFSIRNMTEMANVQQEGTKTFTTLLAWIAAVSLLVGGIGIMNIMLVSVTERTREIGLRMAVGAKPHHILVQFLTEALTLTMIGGLLGVGAGVLGAKILAYWLGWAMLVRASVVLVSVVFSGVVGVVFGLYPATKASRLDPIDALRHE